jgi:hypothetical protein
MFLGDPHTVARSYKTIRAKLGEEIFGKNHQLVPYYVAAFTLYRLEYLFRSHKVAPQYKPARYHILFAVRLFANPSPMPPMNANAMKTYCDPITVVLWDAAKSDEIFARAVAAIDEAAGGKFSRDVIRTLPFTERVMKACGVAKPGPQPSPSQGAV